MNICFAINNEYVEQCATLILSILENNKHEKIDFYILSEGITEKNKAIINTLNKTYKNWNVSYIVVDKKIFEAFKLNIDYISIETYFRYILADIMPETNKCLYIDADTVCNGSLTDLYDTDIEKFYCAGVKDLYIEEINYKEKIDFNKDNLYINAGVMLFNLAKIRQDNMVEKLFENTKKYADRIEYQDQDILNITFKNKIKELDSVYNYTVSSFKKEKNKADRAVIIHFNGKKKPWNSKYKFKKQGNIYKKYNALLHKICNKKIKVALLIDEFFGGAGTALGGYGFLARRYIAKYIPNEEIQIDVLLGKNKHRFWAKKYHEDNVDLYRLPKNNFMAKLWLKKKNYDLYLSIELTSDFVLKNETDKSKKLVLWIQDPRPKYEWDEINTVKLFPETCYYNQNIYNLVHRLHQEKRIKFISQGYFLNPKAVDLYNLPKNTSIQYMPNPIDIDEDFDVINYKKKNNIIFLGRVESVKRGWLFCEIAKKMPQYQFYVLGQSLREKEKNTQIMKQYLSISNLHFVGHVDGKEKMRYLKDAKILVNTSIHEALPISFLEALSYGTLLVSNRNPEDLTSKFGKWVGNVLGDGFDKVDLYVKAIDDILSDEEYRLKLAKSAITYIRKNHNVPDFVNNLRKIIWEEVRR